MLLRKHRFAVVLASGIGLTSLFAVACVDLFHSTDFPTLCDNNPSDPQCTEGGADGTTSSSGGDGAVRSYPHDFCKSYTSPNQVIQRAGLACARLSGCVGALSGTANALASTSIGDCMIAAQLAFDCTANPQFRPSGAADTFWACMDSAQSCGDVKDCVYPQGGEQQCGGRPGGGSSGTSGPFYACAATDPTRIECLVETKQLPLAAVPCAMAGQICERDSPDGGASLCGGPQGVSCDASMCMGDFASFCEGMNDVGVDCAQQSSTCTTDGGSPECVPTTGSAQPCTTDDTPICTGSVVSTCVGGKQVQVDCSRLGDGTTSLDCDVTTLPHNFAISAACKAAGGCTGGDPSCTGDVLTGCARGVTLGYSCKSAGFEGCTDGGPQTLAHCTTPADDTTKFF